MVGDRWSLLIVRDLMFAGFRSYKEFLSSDEGIATDILAERLERLKHEGGAGPAASIVKKWKADREGFLAEVREQWMRDDPAAPRTRR